MVGGIKGLIIVPDGIKYDIFKDMLDKDKLPNIKEHIVDRLLVSADNAFSVNPSSTSEAMPALMTGCFPCFPGSTYLRNMIPFDLLRKQNPSKGDCTKKRTIFGYDFFSVSIHNPWNDGANDKHPDIYSLAMMNYLIGRWRGSNSAAALRYRHTLRYDPDFTGIWLPSFDRYGHNNSDHGLKRRYHQLDRFVGNCAEAQKDAGTYDSTTISLVSDHSNARAKKVNPNELCFKAGLRPRIGRRMDDYDCWVFAYGYGVCQIYLQRPIRKLPVIDRLLEHPAVEHVIEKNPEGNIVHSKDSVSVIRKEGDNYCMEVLAGKNPFGYPDDLVEKLSKPHSARKSLELTYMQEQPNAVVGIAESLTHPDAPDMRLLASPGYSFARVRNALHPLTMFNPITYRSHGTLHRDNSQIVFMIGGPPIVESKQVKYASIVDWMPTQLALMGITLEDRVDGISLV